MEKPFDPVWLQDTSSRWWIKINDHDPVHLVEPFEVVDRSPAPKQPARRGWAAPRYERLFSNYPKK
jgi:hypothetical protein